MAEPKPSDINNDLIIYRLDEIKGQLADFKVNYVTKDESAALKQEIKELRLDVHELKNKKVFRDTILWIGLTASAIINIIALYNVFNNKG
jgi:hypothetical protein